MSEFPPSAPPPAAPPPPGNPYGQTTQLSPADEKLWATLIHIGGIFFGFLPSLIGYLILKDKGPFIRLHTAAALNFQISLTIYIVGLYILGTILLFVVVGIVFYIAAFAVAVAAIVFMIIAAVAANKGQPYSYPLTITFVR